MTDPPDTSGDYIRRVDCSYPDAHWEHHVPSERPGGKIICMQCHPPGVTMESLAAERDSRNVRD